MWPPARHTSFARGGVWGLSVVPCHLGFVQHPHSLSWLVNKKGADTIGVHSSQAITFRMMVVTTHFFYEIKERAHVFIPLEFKHHRDTRPLWRTAFFSYLNRVWEWVQVISDHVANHYTALAHAYAATKA